MGRIAFQMQSKREFANNRSGRIDYRSGHRKPVAYSLMHRLESAKWRINSSSGELGDSASSFAAIAGRGDSLPRLIVPRRNTNRQR